MKATFVSMCLIVVFCLSLITRVNAQQTDEPIRLKSELIQIDLVVTDKQNRLVTDLRKEDFILMEDNSPQEISFFSLIKPTVAKTPNAASTPATAASGAFGSEPEPGRLIFVILDQYNLNPANYPRIRDSLMAFISEDLSPLDQVAIIGTRGKLAIFNHVTKNKEILQLAVQAFLGSGGNYNVPSLSLTSEEQGVISSASDQPSASEQMFREHIIRSTYQTIEAVAKSADQAPGRKIAILFSENLPFHASGNPFGTGIGSTDNFSYEIQRVVSRARRGGLVFYAIDPKGLAVTIPGGSASEYQGRSVLGGNNNSNRNETNGIESDRLLGSRLGMSQLAAETGGFAVFNRNDLRTGLTDVLKDNEAYYMLAYYPTNSALDGKLRRVKITVKGRPDLTVRARSGYFAPTEKEQKAKPESKQDRIKNALAALTPVRNLKVSIYRADAIKTGFGAKPEAQLIIQVDPQSFPFKKEGDLQTGSIEVIAYAYDLNNKLSGGFSKTINMKLRPEVYARVMAEGLNMKEKFELNKSGVYNIRVVIIDNSTGQMGTAGTWLKTN
jgi:VWFA-related protein